MPPHCRPALVLLLLLAPWASGCFLTSSEPETPDPDQEVVEDYEPPPTGPTPCTTDGKLVPVADAYTYVHGGRTLYFCCDDCIRKFLEDPGRYAPRADSR